MLRLASLVILAAPLVGCAVHSANMRTELVATGAPGNSIALAQGIYALNLRVGVPQAQTVHWTLTCPGVEKDGVIGETFDNYRHRRLAEINQQQSSDRRTASTAASFAASLAPRVVATNGPVTASAGVDPNAAGAAAASAIPEITELPPGDVGAGMLFATLQFMTASDGACSLALDAADPRMQASFEVTRTYDVDFENGRHAHEVRGTLVAQLSAQGADPDARAKRLYAEAQAREKATAEKKVEDDRIAAELAAKQDAELVVTQQHEAQEREQRVAIEDKQHTAEVAEDARARAEYEERIERERKVRIEFELRIRLSIESTRRLLVGYLVGIGADAGHYAAEQERIRLEMEMRLRIQVEENERREARLRIEQEARDRRDMEANRQRQHAIDVAMIVRASLRARLLALGARERPEMPALLHENHGAAPFDGAVWIAGSWTFNVSSWSWSWTRGGWGDNSSFGDSGTAGGDVRAPAYVEPSVAIEEPVVAPIVTPVVVRPAVIVETPAVRTPTITVRVPTPTITIHTHTVRPQRETPPRSSTARPVIRDHRK